MKLKTVYKSRGKKLNEFTETQNADIPALLLKQIDLSYVHLYLLYVKNNPIEVLHGGHVACQEQCNIIPMGQNVHSNAKHFYYFWHATWPPCKTSIEWVGLGDFDSFVINSWQMI